MAPAGQAWSTVTDLAAVGRLPGHRSPRRPGPRDAGRDGDGAATGRGYGLGLRLIDARRAAADRAHRVDARLPGQPLRRPRDRATAASLLTNATTGLGMEWVPEDAARRRRARRRPSRGRRATAYPTPLAGVPGVWFWGNTALELRWHRGRAALHELGDPTTPTCSRYAATGSSASRATTAARPSTSTVARTVRSATSSARRSSTPASRTTRRRSPAVTREVPDGARARPRRDYPAGQTIGIFLTSRS